MNDLKSLVIEGEEDVVFSQEPLHEILVVIERIENLKEITKDEKKHSSRKIIIKNHSGTFKLVLFQDLTKIILTQGYVYLFKDLKKRNFYDLYETTKNTSIIENPNSEESKKLFDWNLNIQMNLLFKSFGESNGIDFLRVFNSEKRRLEQVGIPFGPVFLSIQGYDDSVSDLFKYIKDSKRKGFQYICFALEDSFGNPDRATSLKNGLSFSLTSISTEKWKTWFHHSQFFYKALEEVEKEVDSWEKFEISIGRFYDRTYSVPFNQFTFINKIWFIWKGKFKEIQF